MEEFDDDTKARKRRRRSIRNLRRQSGIVPFSLGEEPSSDEQPQAISEYQKSLVARKTVIGVSYQVQHKLGCTVTEDG